ncbi:hypothetical protein [Rheinheimera maricola]|nr:hypothetical protein [Rheinheimera maricola]
MIFYEIKFKFPPKKNLKKIEECVLNTISTEPPVNTGVERKKDEVNIYGEMLDEFNKKLCKPIFELILAEGGFDALIKIFHESVGEYVYYSFNENEVVEIDFAEWMSRKQANKEQETFIFDGKDGNDNTLLLRARVKSEKKREGLKSIFLIEDESSFKEAFNSYDPKKIKWPSSFVDDRWEEGPENLFDGFSFVVEKDNFLYIGYNLEGISIVNQYSITALLYAIMATGATDKVWAKHRKKGMGEKQFVELEGTVYYGSFKDKTKDDFWRF